MLILPLFLPPWAVLLCLLALITSNFLRIASCSLSKEISCLDFFSQPETDDWTPESILRRFPTLTSSSSSSTLELKPPGMEIFERRLLLITLVELAQLGNALGLHGQVLGRCQTVNNEIRIGKGIWDEPDRGCRLILTSWGGWCT